MIIMTIKSKIGKKHRKKKKNQTKKKPKIQQLLKKKTNKPKYKGENKTMKISKAVASRKQG